MQKYANIVRDNQICNSNFLYQLPGSYMGHKDTIATHIHTYIGCQSGGWEGSVLCMLAGLREKTEDLKMFPSGIILFFLQGNFTLIYNLTTQFMSSLFLALLIQFPFTNRFNFIPTKRQRPISS